MYYKTKQKSLTKEEKRILSKILEKQANRYKYAISLSQDDKEKQKKMNNIIKTIFSIIKKLNLPRIKIYEKKSSSQDSSTQTKIENE